MVGTARACNLLHRRAAFPCKQPGWRQLRPKALRLGAAGRALEEAAPGRLDVCRGSQTEMLGVMHTRKALPQGRCVSLQAAPQHVAAAARGTPHCRPSRAVPGHRLAMTGLHEVATCAEAQARGATFLAHCAPSGSHSHRPPGARIRTSSRVAPLSCGEHATRAYCASMKWCRMVKFQREGGAGFRAACRRSAPGHAAQGAPGAPLAARPALRRPMYSCGQQRGHQAGGQAAPTAVLVPSWYWCLVEGGVAVPAVHAINVLQALGRQLNTKRLNVLPQLLHRGGACGGGKCTEHAG